MKNYLNKIIAKEDLSFEEIQEIVKGITKKEFSEAQIGAFLVAITQKGVTKEEFFAFAAAMREFSTRVIVDKYIVDSCGTGADLSNTINISTASAIVANTCGANVVKQTNSSITSSCGSSDLLKALDIRIARIIHDAASQFNRHNITFVHSPYFNEFAAVNNPIRQQLGIKTIFNYLGPLINPAFPNAQLLGVSSLEMCEKIAYALQKLGTDRALVVNGLNPNLDEISISSETAVYELKNGEILQSKISPEDFGFKKADIAEIKGGNSAHNAKIIEGIFKGEITDAKLNVIAMNAGAMIYLAGIKPDIFEGVQLALEAIKSGAVYEKLRELQNKFLHPNTPPQGGRENTEILTKNIRN
ncbi:MAG: anthranilate phosphoribosyltransferase [Candidatus Gastranaerophilales bacterium]|nr:anthranilate phosphoribosyltransferase [Candidatus Gastranaerophilales bacterium]